MSPVLPEHASRSSYTLEAIQAQVGGELIGDPQTRIVGVNALEAAGPDQLAFAESEKYLAQARKSRAAALIVPTAFPSLVGRTVLRVDHARWAFTQVMHLFQSADGSGLGVDHHAVVAPDAELGDAVTIRECAVIRSHARIGRGTVIESGAHIGERVSIGEQCFIGPNVVIMRDCRIGHRVIIHGGTVIGADGFGFLWIEGRHQKIPQLGTVIIEDDVELGANVCVDRATLGATIVKRGTKVDNLVQIAHNDVIGENVIISGQVGIAGSVQVGHRVIFGGQAGIADHLTIGDDVRVGAGSIVIKDIPAGETVWWFPARPIKKAKEQLAMLGLLPRVMKQLGSRPARRTRRAGTSSKTPRRV